MRVLSVPRRLEQWRWGGLVGVLVIMLAVACGVSANPGGQVAGDSSSLENATAGQQQQPAAREIPVNGGLVFPRRVELTFDTSGKVGEILVQEGDRVTQGQVLARLEDLRITALRTELAQAEFDRDAAQKSLEAEFEDQVARARKELEDAEERLTDFQRDHQLDLAQAMQAKADAEKGMDDTVESLEDFQIDYQQTLASAMRAKAQAEEDLDDVLRNLGNFERDRVQDLADARQLVADKELALEAAQKDLANFDDDYQESLANAKLAKAIAEDNLDIAKDDLTLFWTNPTHDARDEERIDIELVERLEAAVAEAQTNLAKANNDLARLQNDRALLLEEAQAAVPQAQAELVKTRDDLAKLEREVDRTLNLQMRQANYEVAQAKLAQAEVDLYKEMKGPDPVILRQLEASVESAQAKLSQAEADLEEEMTGPDQAELAVREKAVALARKKLEDLIAPDSYDVALRQSKLAAAQARVDDALEELEGGTIRAPIDGVVSLVNVEVDDDVNDESRVLEIIDPTAVEVDGIIDAIDVQFVEVGAAARVTISSLPGEEFEGTVVRVANEPRTERGVVSYPVRVAVNLPEGFQVSVRLAAVTTVILYPGASGP